MQTSKLFLVVCAFTLLVGVLYPRADETEAQKRAREALRQKMLESEGQPQPAVPAAPAKPEPPVATPAPKVAPAAATSPAPVAAFSTSLPDSEAQAKARAALRQAMGESTPGVVGSMPPSSTAFWTPAGTDNAAQARAREALWQKMRELDAQQSVVYPSGMYAYQPIVPPPSPLSGDKVGRLAELLSRYRTDLITPEEYHKQRAAILAEP